MKYIFKQIDNISVHNAETTIEFDAEYLPDILQHFEMFLRGSGFHPSGTLDFVNEDEYFEDCPQFEPAEEESAQEECPFPLHKTPESIYEDGYESPSGSVIMDWTAAQLIRPPKMEDICPVCKIDMQTMLTHECWDNNCPKGKDAN
jgi:hypothetical protein